MLPVCAGLQDLETRKRAPLYQKKQEEELKAAVDKAQECEIRATEAELKYKEAKVGAAGLQLVLGCPPKIESRPGFGQGRNLCLF